jgi:hypothetical protein
MILADLFAGFAVLVSILSACISWYTFDKTDELTHQGFIRNYRPYLAAGNYSYLLNDTMYPQVYRLMITLYNAPAFIKTEKLAFYKRGQGLDSLIFEHPTYGNFLWYPLANGQNTIETDPKVINDLLAKKIYPDTLIRKLRLEYQWISDSSLNYYFDAEWRYDMGRQDWISIYEKAD